MDHKIISFTQNKSCLWYDFGQLARRLLPSQRLTTSKIRLLLVKEDDPLDVRGDWCYLLKNSSTMDLEEYSVFKQKGGVMAEAAEHLWVLSQDETLQEIVAMEQRNKMDQRAREQDAHEEGLEKGLQKGLQKGQLAKEQDIISNMLKNKMDISTIVKITKETEDKILDIQKKLDISRS